MKTGSVSSSTTPVSYADTTDYLENKITSLANRTIRQFGMGSLGQDGRLAATYKEKLTNAMGDELSLSKFSPLMAQRGVASATEVDDVLFKGAVITQEEDATPYQAYTEKTQTLTCKWAKRETGFGEQKGRTPSPEQETNEKPPLEDGLLIKEEQDLANELYFVAKRQEYTPPVVALPGDELKNKIDEYLKKNPRSWEKKPIPSMRTPLLYPELQTQRMFMSRMNPDEAIESYVCTRDCCQKPSEQTSTIFDKALELLVGTTGD